MTTPIFARMRHRAEARRAMQAIQEMPRQELDDIGLTPEQAADAMFLSRIVF
ncbi:DUF1127 domain-containing protein [Ovoidimarina sediminis]|uniref:DUF1127 domain-containing protein n=1 Tax=Ovoidimarina sediminis TaxID=3079856 RepID=UPI00292FA96E|nr:DUF1127 domain-containing protein [Rhodophyticola sp. MJ-SS7]